MKLEYELVVYSDKINNLTTVLNKLDLPFYMADDTYDTHKTITSVVSAHMTEEDLCVLKLHIDDLVIINVDQYTNNAEYRSARIADISHLRYKYVMEKFT